MVYSTRRFVLCLTLCYFVLVFFSPFSIAITSLGEERERANIGAFRAFVRFVHVWFCRFPLPLGVWEGLFNIFGGFKFTVNVWKYSTLYFNAKRALKQCIFDCPKFETVKSIL